MKGYWPTDVVYLSLHDHRGFTYRDRFLDLYPMYDESIEPFSFRVPAWIWLA